MHAYLFPNLSLPLRTVLANLHLFISNVNKNFLPRQAQAVGVANNVT